MAADYVPIEKYNSDAAWKNYGAVGSQISQYHKIWIVHAASKICVAGYLGEGTSREIVSNWDTPFADSSLGAYFKQFGGILQKNTDMTSQTTLNSQQVWSGNQPYTFNLVMKLRAFTDPVLEVEQAIEALEMFMAPNLKSNEKMSFFGQPLPSTDSRVPQTVDINFGRKRLLLDCIIRSMSTPYDKEKDVNGNLIRADVSLQVETIRAIVKTDLQATML